MRWVTVLLRQCAGWPTNWGRNCDDADRKTGNQRGIRPTVRPGIRPGRQQYGCRRAALGSSRPGVDRAGRDQQLAVPRARRLFPSSQTLGRATTQHHMAVRHRGGRPTARTLLQPEPPARPIGQPALGCTAGTPQDHRIAASPIGQIDANQARTQIAPAFPWWGWGNEAREVTDIPEATGGCTAAIYELLDGSVGYFAFGAPPWQEAGEITGEFRGQALHVLEGRGVPSGKATWTTGAARANRGDPTGR